MSGRTGPNWAGLLFEPYAEQLQRLRRRREEHHLCRAAVIRLKFIHDDAVLEEPPDIVAHVSEQTGDIGEDAFSAGAINPLGFTDKPGGVGVAIGDVGDIHGQHAALYDATITVRNIAQTSNQST